MTRHLAKHFTLSYFGANICTGLNILVTICCFLYHSSNLLRSLSNRRKLRILMNYYSNEAKPCRTWCILFCSIYVFEVGGNRRSMQSFLSYFSLLYNFLCISLFNFFILVFILTKKIDPFWQNRSSIIHLINVNYNETHCYNFYKSFTVHRICPKIILKLHSQR